MRIQVVANAVRNSSVLGGVRNHRRRSTSSEASCVGRSAGRDDKGERGVGDGEGGEYEYENRRSFPVAWNERQRRANRCWQRREQHDFVDM